jgi:hypothetical protein
LAGFTDAKKQLQEQENRDNKKKEKIAVSYPAAVPG